MKTFPAVCVNNNMSINWVFKWTDGGIIEYETLQYKRRLTWKARNNLYRAALSF